MISLHLKLSLLSLAKLTKTIKKHLALFINTGIKQSLATFGLENVLKTSALVATVMSFGLVSVRRKLMVSSSVGAVTLGLVWLKELAFEVSATYLNCEHLIGNYYLHILQGNKQI